MPRQVAEALDKNYHTTRCLLRKLEAVGEIQHTDNQYVAIPRDNSGNQSDYTDDRNQRNHRNQTVPSTLQHDDQVARGEESCLPATDYSDYTDDAHERVSANVSPDAQHSSSIWGVFFAVPISIRRCALSK